MTTLTIGRLSATAHGGNGERVAAMLDRLATRGLDEALRSVSLPAGDWYVRHLDLTVTLDDAGTAAEIRWAAAVLDALRRALAGASPDVVHHPRPVDGLVELITEVAAGRTERAWAWRRAGLLQAGDPAPDAAPAEALLAAARRRPELVCAALVTAARAVGVPALHRMLGAGGWQRLAVLVRAAAGGPATLPATFAGPAPRRAEDRTASPPAGTPTTAAERPDGAAIPDRATAEAARLSATALARSVLAAEFRDGRIRPTAEVAPAWAVLVAAEADPGLLSRRRADDVLRHLAAVLSGQAPAAPAVAPRLVERPHAPTAAARPSADPAEPSLPPAPHAAPSPPAPVAADPAADIPAAEPDTAAPTGWAGLLFLLATAEDADVPGALLDDPALAGRSLRWILSALVPHLLAAASAPPVADDPAVLAFAGLVPTDAPPEGRPASPAEVERLDAHARRWAEATARRLGRLDGGDPALLVAEVARRRGAVVAVPGWIEMHLPLDEVDVDLRRAGLDLDPGWVPWLGAVVRYVYV